MEPQRAPTEKDALAENEKPQMPQQDLEAEKQRAIDSVLRYIDPLGQNLAAEISPETVQADDAQALPSSELPAMTDEANSAEGSAAEVTEDALDDGASGEILSPAVLKEPFEIAQRQTTGDESDFANIAAAGIGATTINTSAASADTMSASEMSAAISHVDGPRQNQLVELNRPSEDGDRVRSDRFLPIRTAIANRSRSPGNANNAMLAPTSDGGPPLARPIVMLSFSQQKTSRVVQDALDAAAARDAKTLEGIADDVVGWELFKRDGRKRACRGR